MSHLCAAETELGITTILKVIHKILIESHLEWCNAMITSSLCETRESEGRGGNECEIREKETEEDSEGLITAYHWEYNVYLSNSPVRSSPCQRMIAEIKGQLATRPSPCRSLALHRTDLDGESGNYLQSKAEYHFKLPKRPKWQDHTAAMTCNPQQQRCIKNGWRSAASHKRWFGC